MENATNNAAAGASPQPSVGQQMEDGLKAIAKRFGHDYWYAGQEGCPPELKATNGELHTLRCKKCGKDKPDSKWCEGASPQPVQPADKLERYLAANYPDAKGNDLTEAVIDALETMDIALGMKEVAQPVQQSPAPTCDLRGIDAGQLSEWVDLVKHGYVAKDECLIAVKDVPKWVAQNDTQPVQPSPARELCEWTLDDDESGTWASSCGELWSFIDGGPKENRVTYCHHCGKLAAINAKGDV